MATPAPFPSAPLFPGRLLRRGKVRDVYQADGEAAGDRRERPHQRVRRRARSGHSRKGHRPDPAVELLVRDARGRRPQPPAGDPPRGLPRAFLRGSHCSKGRACLAREVRIAPGGVRRPRVHRRLGVEGVPGAGERVRGPAAGRSAAGRPPPRTRSSRRPPRPRSATTRTSRSTRSCASSAATSPNSLRSVSLELYRSAAALAEARGIIIADTKFEFGLDDEGKLVWADEALTPDSSRFWPADLYRPGSNPPSFDKQFVRDWLEACGWDKQPPGPDAAARRRGADPGALPRGATAASPDAS